MKRKLEEPYDWSSKGDPGCWPRTEKSQAAEPGSGDSSPGMCQATEAPGTEQKSLSGWSTSR